MAITFINLIFLNLLTFLFTAVMAVAGVGAAFIIIPLIFYFGYDFLTATTFGLLLNTFSTGTSSVRHVRNNAVDYRVALPIIVSSIITTPLGAIYSDSIPRETLRFLFGLFLLFVGVNILWKTMNRSDSVKGERDTFKKKETRLKEKTIISEKKRVMISLGVGAIVGFLAGLLGVGGGSLILPFLLYFGLETKKAAGTTSFIVVFSSLLGFVSKMGLTDVNLDPVLAVSLIISTIIAATIGSYLMHFKLNKYQIRETMGIMLLLVAAKIFYDLFK